MNRPEGGKDRYFEYVSKMCFDACVLFASETFGHILVSIEPEE